MDKKKAKWLLRRITNSQYVNLHFENMKSPEPQLIEKIIEEISEGHYTNDYLINVNIKKLPLAQKEAGKIIVNIINDQMTKVQFSHWFHDAESIEDALVRLNQRLDKSAIIIFSYFQHYNKNMKRNKNNDIEKSILIPIRKFIPRVDSIYLKMLIISNITIENWCLSPFSPLDDRFVEYIDYNKIAHE